MCKRILYQQGWYQISDQTDKVSHVGFNCSRYDTLQYCGGNAVYVELRNYEDDYILEIVSVVDREEIRNAECFVRSASVNEYELIRTAIEVFDNISNDHPLMKLNKSAAVAEVNEEEKQ